MNKKSILIDGNSLVYRMFYGVREMSNSKGIPTNAIYGFVNVLVKIQNEYKPDYLAVAFDLSAPTFRHKEYEDYKGGRDKMPEDLPGQMDLLKELLGKMGIPMITKEGYEADAPYNGSIWIAAEGRVACAEVGNTRKIIKTKSAETVRTSAAYDRLANMGQRLLEVIRHNQGGANKDLAKFADQINALCDKWDR